MMRWVACEIIRASWATSHRRWSCACALVVSIVLAKGKDRGQVLSELVVQFTGKHAPLVVADFQ